MSEVSSKISSVSAALPGEIHQQCEKYLLKYFREGRRQENLCFGLWRPSVGAKRLTALVHKLVLPLQGELELTGNVSFGAPYLDRASQIAAHEESGLVLMHNHFGAGWQGMSPDDVRTEEARAPFVVAATGLPLIGMTLGTDEAWSARFWSRSARRKYTLHWCESVRVVGVQLRSTFHPELSPAPPPREELLRTISAWGEQNQAIIARTHVGIVGLGSVGRLVLEAVARMGVRRVTLIDFDRIERVNLDRLLCAYPEDAVAGTLKVISSRAGFLRASTARNPEAEAVPYSVTELAGFEAALDCDVLFSCVDRPWGRQVLNHIAYAHLIPVVDGGILIRTPRGKFKGANWSIRTVGPGRCCLGCCGQLDPGMVDVERKGLLDDPMYFEGLPADERAEASQNVFPFSMCVAGHQVVQFVSLLTALLNRADLGEQRYHYNIGEMRIEEPRCEQGCLYQSRVASGESQFPRSSMTGKYRKTDETRQVGQRIGPLALSPKKISFVGRAFGFLGFR